MPVFEFGRLPAGDRRKNLSDVLLWLPVNIVQLFSFLVVSGILIPAALIVRVVAGSSRAAIGVAHRWWGPIVVGGGLARLRVTGSSNMAPGKTYLVVANHQSYFDIPVLFAALPAPIHFVSADSIRAIPGVGQFCGMTGTIFLQRTSRSSMVWAARELANYLRKGRTTVLFPEGTRTRDGNIAPFFPALLTSAIEAGVEILPVAIHGTRKVMPRGSGFLFRPGRVEVRIGSPIQTTGLDAKDRDVLTQEVWQAVNRMFTGGKVEVALHG